ncbi:Alpha/Beta hydrolase protein [Achaetomium macrosporum]|uniref:Carboxylic ester hydrolase n=1 Tax=Achaetomium macrosporum TaxID=79813 RepID=A0AAN7C1U3_9PEZI|nr:Alpha/Beta hydrolase protein [Achaetomium macrosporum]
MKQFPTLTLALAAIPFAEPSACRPPRWTVGQTVQTTSGPVEGHAASVASGVSEYLGIPYAQPPVGSLRFRPPVRYNGTKKIDGKNFGPACIPSNISAFDGDYEQSGLAEKYGITDVGLRILKSIMNPEIPVSEDCLTLNIWTKPQTGEKRKAVMVWVHGGSFVSGSSAVPAYNGQFFADQEDVVLVSINYRLSIFGFPGNPHAPQNLGLLDQRLAVEWVRDNIASFGGDPSRITLFGESAGGASVDHYSFAWASDPIVAGLIAMSGTREGITPQTASDAATLWYNTTTALGCGNASTPPTHLLSCMQSVSPAAILATLVNTIVSPTRMPYSPSIDNTLVFAAPSSHPVAPVPLLIGTTDAESALFRVFVPGPDSDAFWANQTAVEFTCPAARRALRSAVADGQPTWRYRWMGVFPNTELGRTPPTGAYHDSETAVLFGNVDQSVVRNTKEEARVGRWMRGAWAAFARDPERGLEKIGWPRYGGKGKTLARIGWENRTVSLVRGDAYDAGCLI